MKKLYYRAMYEAYLGLTILALSWANNYETVNRLSDSANHYWKKIID